MKLSKKLSDLFTQRDALTAPVRELAAVEQEIAATQAAEAAEAKAKEEAARAAALAQATGRQHEAEQTVAGLVVQLQAAIEVLEAAEQEVRTLTRQPIERAVHVTLRQQVKAQLTSWRQFHPQLIGAPVRESFAAKIKASEAALRQQVAKDRKRAGHEQARHEQAQHEMAREMLDRGQASATGLLIAGVAQREAEKRAQAAQAKPDAS